MTNTSKFWVGALIVGAVGVGAAVANRNRVDVTPAVPMAAAEDVAQPVVSKAALPMPAPRKAVVVEPLVLTPERATIVKPMLQPGTDLTMASEGFGTFESFVATARAAKNLGIPFVVLKDRVVAQRLPLASAIRELKPEVDAKAEASRAVTEARSEIGLPR